MALLVVERLVQQKYLMGGEPQRLQLPAQLVVRVSIQPPGQQRMEVARAQVHLHRFRRMERIREIANGAQLLADGAALLLGAQDQRLGFALSESFLTIRTD